MGDRRRLTEADLPFFETRWGEGYSIDEDVVSMVPPKANCRSCAAELKGIA